jgi:septation ring formation regulator EzrA
MVGNKKYSKPKPVERKTEIIPKHIRDNPFSDPLPVSVNDINKGLFNLLNKGYIAKDVDVSTAFERGQPPIRTRGAILHHFEERMVRDIP